MKRWITGFAVAAALTAPACAQSAPSFDCRSNTAPDERAICANAMLSRLDRQLAAAYAAARSSLDAAGQTELRQAQRAWLRARADCGAQVSCLTVRYTERLEQLQHRPPVAESGGGGGGPSFDCRSNTAPDERAICANRSLSRLDRELAASYAAARSVLDARGQTELRQAQRDWLRLRRDCGADVSCLEARYTQRIAALDGRGEQAAAPSPGAVAYPLVFQSSRQLSRLGLSIGGWGTDRNNAPPPLKNQCYYYGDGGYAVSFTDEFSAPFRARGFSRRSLCMALVSEARFDPETGERLPTYLVADVGAIRAGQVGMDPGIITSDQLPLVLPDCFRRGLPYSDCRMRYDLKTGERLSAAAEARYRQMGQQIERFLQDQATRASFQYLETSPYTRGMIMVGAAQNREGLDEVENFAFYDYSSEFPKGYGYALNADGSAGPDPGNAAIRIAMDSRYQATDAKIAAFRRSADERAPNSPSNR